MRRFPRPAPAKSSNAPYARPSGAGKKSASKGETIMWQQIYTPIGNSLALSALFAALPIFTLLLLLGVLRKPAWIASLAGLAAAVVVAAGVFRLPPRVLARTVTYVGA